MSDNQGEPSKPSKKDFTREKGTTHLPIARVQKIIKAEWVLCWCRRRVADELHSKEMENCAKEATYLIAVATVG